MSKAGLLHALWEHSMTKPPWWRPLARRRWFSERAALVAAAFDDMADAIRASEIDPAPPVTAQ